MLYQTPAKPYAASLSHEHEAKRNANEPPERNLLYAVASLLAVRIK